MTASEKNDIALFNRLQTETKKQDEESFAFHKGIKATRHILANVLALIKRTKAQSLQEKHVDVPYHAESVLHS